MKIRIILSLLFISVGVLAQNEAAIWSLGSGIQFNFKTGNPEISEFTGNENANATICDSTGNLVLYTDGNTVWNGNNKILQNGTDLVPEHNVILGRPQFIPFPKNPGYYLMIYQYVPDDPYGYDIEDKNLAYSEININGANGLGEVVTKNQTIHGNYHFEPMIAGYCNNNYYWLVVDRNNPEIRYENRRDVIYFYKIDENGVHKNTPVINSYFDIGNSSGYRFSPNGDKLFFTYAENQIEVAKHVIADFNFLTGELYNYRVFPYDEIWIKEFSPDSRFLYYFTGTKLMQINVDNSSVGAIQKSKFRLIDLPDNGELYYPGIDMQLAPDGKIYFLFHDYNDNKYKIGRINNPNEAGITCNVELDFYTPETWDLSFPDFATSFFRDNIGIILDEIFPDAGPELELCSRSKDSIGTFHNPEAKYLWIPGNYVENPYSPRTVFNGPLREENSEKIVEILRATDGNCWINFDETTINVLPQPAKVPVDGSWSVCPYVEEVDYWANSDKYDLQWLVDGGEIVANPSRDSVKINWWDTNFHASASVIATNNYGCVSDTSVFPVQINVELLTETPNGPRNLCIAEATDIGYHIRKTNGSVYEWRLDGGEITEGQGSNAIKVHWNEDGVHQVFVEETSITIDTICYGESEPLEVVIVNDSIDIQLNSVSFTLSNNIQFNYQSEQFERPRHSMFLEVENADGKLKEEVPTQGTYQRMDRQMMSEILRLKVVNSCGEAFYSNRQQSIVLRANVISYGDSVQLNWNTNRYWDGDDLIHELWYSIDGQQWIKINTIEYATSYHIKPDESSFTHYFRVNEINRTQNLESWSNTFELKIEDKLSIPDVFTPNGDGINDVWIIPKIQFYHLTGLKIFNRYGEMVYQCKNSFQPWDGKINGEIIQGVYFYQLEISGEKVRYGQLTLLQ